MSSVTYKLLNQLNYIINSQRLIWVIAAISLAASASFVILYTVRTPYTGLTLALQQDGWHVVMADCAPDCELRDGDLIVQVNGLSAAEQLSNRSRIAFDAPIFDMVVERDGETFHAIMAPPPMTPTRIVWRLSAVLFVLPFWLAGVLTTKLRYGSWRVLSLLFFANAVWIGSGIVSGVVSSASSVMVFFSWLLLPLAVHAHWRWPSPIPGLTAKRLRWIYGAVITASIVELLAGSMHVSLLAIVAQVVVSVLLLLWRIARDEARQPAQIMLAGIILSYAPGLLWAVRSVVSDTPAGVIGTYIALFALSLWPIVYLYALHRHRLSGLEQKVRQAVVFASFVILYINASALAWVMFGTSRNWQLNEIINHWLQTAVVVALSVAAWDLHGKAASSLLYGRLETKLNSTLTDVAMVAARADLKSVLAAMAQIQSRLELDQMALYINQDGQIRLLKSWGRDAPEIYDKDPPWADFSLPLTVDEEKVGHWLIGPVGEFFYTPGHVVQLRRIASLIAMMIQINRQQQALQRQLEKMVQQEKLAALGRMSASVAHQFRNPLQAISLALEAHMGPDMYKQSDSYLLTAYNQVEQLAQIVNVIMSRVRPERRPAQMVSVNDEVQQALTFSRHIIASGRVSLSLELDRGVPSVMVSPGDIAQVIGNLVENACDAMPDGGTLRICTSLSKQKEVEIKVSDTGVGIRSDEQQMLFEPFFTTKPDGTGLGLLLSYSIIEQYQGRISVNSEPGKGSCFRIFLPTGGSNGASVNRG